MQQILILTSAEFMLSDRQLDEIRSAAPGVEIKVKRRKEASAADFPGVDVVFGPPKPEWVAEAPQVRWVQLPWAGPDGWVGIRPDDLLLTKASGTFGIPIAEWVVGSMLMLTRNLHIYRDQQRTALWKARPGAREVYGSTVGIVGLGDIGQEVAKRAQALGCRVIGARRRAGGEVPAGIDAVMPLDELIPQTDFLVLAVPNTPETQRLISRERLFRLKEGAYLINVGRGVTVDEEAMIEALQSGPLAGAALDVTAVEPLPPESPLWQMEQVILSPHCSGSSTEANNRRRLDLFLENLRRYQNQQVLLNLVDLRTGY